MNDPEHLQAFTLHKTNCEWWASYRNSHGAPFDFSDQEFDGFTFSERVFVGCSFQSCEFTNCTFDRAHLQGTNFIRCNFIKCSFTNAITATESTTFQQCTFVRCSALGHVLINIHPLDADFQECIIKEISISEKHLSRWRFKDCIVNSMNFFKCKIDSFSIEGSEAEKSKVTNLNMTGSSIDYFVISNCNLTGLAIKDTSGLFSMSSSSLAIISAEGAKISITTKECQIESFSGNSKEANLKWEAVSCRFLSSSLTSAVLAHSRFSNCEMTNCNFSDSDLTNVEFRSCRISTTIFHRANLTKALMDCERLGTGNDFANAETKDFRIPRYSLEYLGEKHGNLSNGQKMAMDIIDNVEKLRLSFGGFWQMIHILSFLVFVAPYANYLSQILIYDRYLIGESDRAVKSSLAGALWDYIVTAGNPGGETSYAYSTVFFLMLLYNVIRMFLLFKTKHYELKQDCTGLPVVVSLDFNWRSFSGLFTIGLLHRVYKILFFVNVAAALYHMYVFAATPVSLAPRL